MAIHQREPLIKLEDAVKKSKEQKRVLQWFTNVPIECDLQLTIGSSIVQTSVVVTGTGSCMILLLCKIPHHTKITVISGGDFSSLGDLKLYHPKLFIHKGTMKLL